MEHNFLVLDLTSLPISCKQDMLIEDTLTFNHLQFQDTHMYL